MSNIFRRFVLAVVVGSLLLGGVAKASTLVPVCRPNGTGGGIPCTNTTVDSVTGDWTMTVLNAADVQSAHVGSANGDFTQLQVGSGGLSVYGNADVSGGLDVGGWVTGDAAQFHSLSLWFGGVLAFWDNAYASIGAMVTGLRFVGNQILYMRHDGKGLCHVDKSLPNGTVTRWSWLGDDGLDHSTTSLAGVPTSCLDTNGQ